ncbi:MAG: phosphomannomutase/phosphoglucomutase [Alcanivorax sp.]|nr:phosphomannomutase/phosphoglucomutase [Alcanivorax sp.]
MGKNKKKSAFNIDQGSLKLLAPLAATAIVAVIAALLAFYLYQQHQQHQQQQQQTQHLARQLASHTDQLVQAATTQLELLAQRPDINSALAGATSDVTLPALREQWLPGASIDLIPDRFDAANQYSYVAQEMLNDTQLGKKPAPVINASKPATLLVARASRNGTGALLLTMPLSHLKQQLQADLPANAKATLKQGGNTILVVGQGGGSSQAVASHGSIQVTLQRPAPQGNDLMILAASAALAALLILAATAWLAGQLGKRVGQDAAELINYCKELAKRPDVSARNRFQFPVFAQVTAAQARLAEKSRQHGGPPPRSRSPQSAPEAVEMEDSDDILLVDEGKDSVPPQIFRAYDIRGTAGDTLTAQTCYLIGRALGSEAGQAGQQTLFVARDGRLSGPELSRALIKGLQESGRDVINLGDVPTPVLYYATHVMDGQSGICVTGSHNPAQDNGLKMVINGETLYGDRIQALYQRIQKRDFSSGQGSEQQADISDRYLKEIINDIVLARPLKLAIDCGNGITGKLAPRLFTELGCEVTPLYTEVDGHFPNHHPDPSNPDNLADLIRTVKDNGLDLGIAFDGDGDRIVMVTDQGEIIWPDRMLMLFARDLLGRTPGADILFDVKCSRAVAALIRKQGGRPLMYKTGHSLIKAKMQETGAPLAGEMSGHIFFADRWFGFDDALYAASRLLEILSLQDDSSSQVFGQLTTGVTTPELHIPVTDDNKFTLVEALSQRAEQFSGGRATTIDGLRVDFPDGWGLVRASNTTPMLVARFEGRDQDALQRVQTQFHNHLKAVDDSLELPF